MVKTSSSNVGGVGSIPGWGTKIPHALRPKKKKGKTKAIQGFSGGSDGKESAHKAGDPGSIPGSGRSLGERNGNPL